MAVPIQLSAEGPGIEAGTPAPLLHMGILGSVSVQGDTWFMLSSDGRLLMNTLTEEDTSPITVIPNWKPTP